MKSNYKANRYMKRFMKIMLKIIDNSNIWKQSKLLLNGGIVNTLCKEYYFYSFFGLFIKYLLCLVTLYK